MANVLEIIIKATDQSRDAFGTLHGNLVKANEGGISLGGTFKALTIAAGALTVALGGMAVAGLGESVKQTFDWNEQLHELTKRFGMSGEAASAYALTMNHVGLRVDEGTFGLNFFARSLDAAQKNAQNAAKGVDAAGKSLTTFSTKTKDNSEKINKLKEELADANVHLERAKKRLAEAEDPTDAMKYAVDDAQKKVNRLNEELKKTPAILTKTTEKTKAAKEAIDPFSKGMRELGISLFNTHGKAKTFDELMPEIMDKFKKLPEGARASAIAMDLFGARTGSRFLEFLRQGTSGMKKMNEEFKNSGLIISTQQIQATEELGRQFNDLGLVVKGLFVTFGSALLPSLKEFVEFVKTNIAPMLQAWAKEWAPKVGEGMLDLGNIVKDLFNILKGVKGPVGDAKDSLDALAADVATLGNVFGLNGKAIEGFMLKLADGFRSGN